MERQTSFAQAEYAGKKKQTRRERFLAEMEEVVPWQKLVEVIKPYYPTGRQGRPPIGIERMLRIYFLQQWYALADEAREDTLYDSQSLRGFAGIDLSVEDVPDATTLLKFRHLLEDNKLTEGLLNAVNSVLSQKRLLMKEGTIVDATIIAAPSSTKNASGERDPAMHQTKKGNQWYFGMRAHVGADMESGLVHSVAATAANTTEISVVADLLHGEEKSGFGDAGYTGVNKREEVLARSPGMEWHVAVKRGRMKAMREGVLKEKIRELEKLKASVRAKVEHVFHVVKNLFGYRKVRYRGLAKNSAQLHTLFALANLFLVRRTLLKEGAI
jgi:transposase, IS5 family